MVIPSLVQLCDTVTPKFGIIYYEYQKSDLTFLSEYRNVCLASGDPFRDQMGRITGQASMEPSNWASEHSDALRNYFLKGMSFAEIAREINARFGTAYTRSAVIGRAKRMGLAAPKREQGPPIVWPSRTRPLALHQPIASGDDQLPQPAPKPAETMKLRCVGIQPRLICLLDLEPGDCRYPYGGDKDGEAISFCGHPRRPDSSYCMPHFRLTSGPGVAAERATGPVVLRLVAAA